MHFARCSDTLYYIALITISVELQANLVSLINQQRHLDSELECVETLHKLFSDRFSENGRLASRSQLFDMRISAWIVKVIEVLGQKTGN